MDAAEVYMFKIRVWDTYIVGPSVDPVDEATFGIHPGDEATCNEMTAHVEASSAADAISTALEVTGRAHGLVVSIKPKRKLGHWWFRGRR